MDNIISGEYAKYYEEMYAENRVNKIKLVSSRVGVDYLDIIINSLTNLY